jgi:hypothetical protein
MSGLSPTITLRSTPPTQRPSTREEPPRASLPCGSYFGSGYYAANIGDFDGNHLEIVNKSFNPRSRSGA